MKIALTIGKATRRIKRPLLQMPPIRGTGQQAKTSHAIQRTVKNSTSYDDTETRKITT